MTWRGTRGSPCSHRDGLRMGPEIAHELHIRAPPRSLRIAARYRADRIVVRPAALPRDDAVPGGDEVGVGPWPVRPRWRKAHGLEPLGIRGDVTVWIAALEVEGPDDPALSLGHAGPDHLGDAGVDGDGTEADPPILHTAKPHLLHEGGQSGRRDESVHRLWQVGVRLAVPTHDGADPRDDVMEIGAEEGGPAWEIRLRDLEGDHATARTRDAVDLAQLEREVAGARGEVETGAVRRGNGLAGRRSSPRVVHPERHEPVHEVVAPGDAREHLVHVAGLARSLSELHAHRTRPARTATKRMTEM